MKKSNHQPTYRSLARVLEMVVLLGRSLRWWTLSELSKELSCTPRTVYRYIKVMEDAGIEVARDREGDNGHARQYRIEFVHGDRLRRVLGIQSERRMA